MERPIAISNADGAVLNGHRFGFDGFGITAGGEVRRSLVGNLGVFLNVRGSVLMGDEGELAGAPLALVDQELDDVKFIWELQIGSDWTRELSCGAALTTRLAWETQYWDNFSGEPDYDGGEAVGFGGIVVAAGVVR